MTLLSISSDLPRRVLSVPTSTSLLSQHVLPDHLNWKCQGLNLRLLAFEADAPPQSHGFTPRHECIQLHLHAKLLQEGFCQEPDEEQLCRAGATTREQNLPSHQSPCLGAAVHQREGQQGWTTSLLSLQTGTLYPAGGKQEANLITSFGLRVFFLSYRHLSDPYQANL